MRFAENASAQLLKRLLEKLLELDTIDLGIEVPRVCRFDCGNALRAADRCQTVSAAERQARRLHHNKDCHPPESVFQFERQLDRFCVNGNVKGR